MNKGEKRLMIFLLIGIVFFACALIIKINISSQRNEKLYKDIYSEYKEIFSNENSNNKKDEDTKNQIEIEKQENVKVNEKEKSNIEDKYKVIGEISIPRIDVVYPIIYKTTDEYLKIAPTKLAGPNINEVGNFCIVAHNYKYNNEEFFSRLSELDLNDKVFLSAKSRKTICYSVYQKYEVDENDLSCTSQSTNGKIEATLITCTSQSHKRLIIKCIEEE